MAFRIEKRTQIAAGVIALLAAPAAFSQQQFKYEVWHGHSRPPHIKKAGDPGTLVITDSGVSFTETYAKKKPKHPHAWEWTYEDIQQLEVGQRSLRVLTYKDSKWKLGADKEYRFDLRGEGSFAGAYQFLKARLDQRFVAALPDPSIKPLWEIPAKHLLRFGGSQGVLAFGEDGVVYRTDKKGDSRTWRYADIENVSSSGPFQLTLTTYERARAHYGNLKGFNFQLKERLQEAHYNDLWQRVNQANGLKFLASYRERKAGE